MSLGKRVRVDSELHPNRRGKQPERESIKQFGRDLQESLKAFLPTTTKPYKGVKCLLLGWKHCISANEGGVADDINEFSQLLETQYHFTVEKAEFNREDPMTTLNALMYQLALRFIAEQDCLTIIYYIGHGTYSEARRKFFMCSNPINQLQYLKHLDFGGLEKAVNESSAGEVLYIIDSCYSAAAGIETQREVLAACAIEQWADSRAGGLQTFTNALCTSLRNNPRPATVAQIHARLINDWQDSNAEMHLQNTPIHKAASHPRRDSIVLSPAIPHAPPPAIKPESTAAKVLITVKLDDRVPRSLMEWRQWLSTNVPSNIADIDVVGLFESTSKLVLLNIPIALWDMLVDNPAYTFVDYVKSTNLMMKDQEGALSGTAGSSQPLGLRTQDPRRENIRPGSSGRK